MPKLKRLVHFVVVCAPLVLGVSACAQNRTYVLQALGGSAQGLSRLTSEQAGEFGPTLSNDGKTLLFDTRHDQSATIVGIDPSSPNRRTIYTSTSSRAQEAGFDRSGRFFVYTSNTAGAWSLVRAISASPNAAVSIIVSGEMAPVVSDPDLSPDGRRVTFATKLRGTWSVAVANTDGSNFTLMGEGIDPTWSPDGKTLAFVRTAGGRAHIFTMDSETGTNVVQITNGESDNFDPHWAPSGNRLIFTSTRTSTRQTKVYVPDAGDYTVTTFGVNFQLFSLRIDGTELVQLTDGTAANIQPFWGNDGWIYFSSNQAGSFDIWRLRPAGITDSLPAR